MSDGYRARARGFGDWEVEQALQARPSVLAELEQVTDWNGVERRLQPLKKETDVGRPQIRPLMLFKGRLLQQGYGLSDPAAEEASADRFSFRRFPGLARNEAVPDETTICRFRNRRADLKRMPVLWADLDQPLCARGLVVKRGTLVEASLIKAQSRPAKKDASRQPKDQEAAWTVKNGQGLHGYQFHAAVDLDSGLIRRATLTKANVSEGKLFDELLGGDESSGFADTAYSTKARRKALRAKGVYPGILAKRYQRRKMTEEERRRNAQWRPIRAKVEQVFGTLKRSSQLQRARSLGLSRHLNHTLLQAMAFNLKKLPTLVPSC